jgi:hypothetical protein
MLFISNATSVVPSNAINSAVGVKVKNWALVCIYMVSEGV